MMMPPKVAPMPVNDSVHRYGRFGSYISVDLTASVGTHSLRVCAQYQAGWTPYCKQISFTVTGGSTCSAPSSPGVHVCSPLDGSTVASPVHALARGLVSGTFARMELWVDGAKKDTSYTTTLDTSVALGAGSHRFNFRAVNTAGTVWSNPVYVTVK